MKKIVNPNPEPARAVMATIGPPVMNRWFLASPGSIAQLPRMPVVAIDFYPLAPSHEARISHKQEAQIHGNGT